MSERNRIPVRLPDSWAADWVLDRALGSGAFSTVYRAVRRDRPGVEAAIKVISIPGSDAETNVPPPSLYCNNLISRYKEVSLPCQWL